MIGSHSFKPLIAALAALVLTTAGATAQDTPVDRLDDATRNPHVVDTVLAFTNLAATPSRVTLVAYDSTGRRIGSTEVGVPANGVEYVLASELVENNDPDRFIGKVVSRGLGRLTGTAVVIGGLFTNLPTIVEHGRTQITPSESRPYTAITFPLVATY